MLKKVSILFLICLLSPIFSQTKDNEIIKAISSNNINDFRKLSKDYNNPELYSKGLFIAIDNDSITIIDDLLRRGAMSNFLNHNKTTPLLYVIERNKNEIVEFFLERAFDILVYSESKNILLLDYAIKYGLSDSNIDKIKYRISQVSSFNKPLFYHALKSRDYKTINTLQLYNSIRYNDFDEMKLLLSKEVYINKALYNDQTLLLFSLRERQRGATLLIEKGANVNLFDSYGCSPLYQCLLYLQNSSNKKTITRYIKLFLEAGADVNVGNNYMTPIMFATFLDSKIYAEILLEYNADITLSTNYFKSATEVAEIFGTKSVTKNYLEN